MSDRLKQSNPSSSSCNSFAASTRTKSQVKRLEIGPFILHHDYVRGMRSNNSNFGSERMALFHISFAQQSMGFKLYEKVRMEWYWEDIAQLGVAKSQETTSGDTLEWIVVHLRRPPQWRAKLDPSKKTVSSWMRKGYQSVVPPSDYDMDKLFVDVRKKPWKYAQCPPMSDEQLERYNQSSVAVDEEGRLEPCVIHLALHNAKSTWIRYFQYLVQMKRFVNYEPTVAAEARLVHQASLVAPFDDTWCQTTSLYHCNNCDDNFTTLAKVYCLQEKTYLCRTCDIVLHKSRAKCDHQRMSVCRVPQACRDRRDITEPCSCRRGVAICMCAAESLYCTQQCKCQTINHFNYGYDEDDDDYYNKDHNDVNDDVTSAGRTKTTTAKRPKEVDLHVGVPFRLKKKLRTFRGAEPDEATLNSFITMPAPDDEPEKDFML